MINVAFLLQINYYHEHHFSFSQLKQPADTTAKKEKDASDSLSNTQDYVGFNYGNLTPKNKEKVDAVAAAFNKKFPKDTVFPDMDDLRIASEKFAPEFYTFVTIEKSGASRFIIIRCRNGGECERKKGDSYVSKPLLLADQEQHHQTTQSHFIQNRISFFY
jgi:hypothetical protein